jgi:hypothetical protein
MNDDSLVSGDVATWQELMADAPEIVIKHDDLIGRLAEAARRHGVMVNISVSPYELDEVDE